MVTEDELLGLIQDIYWRVHTNLLDPSIKNLLRYEGLEKKRGGQGGGMWKKMQWK